MASENPTLVRTLLDVPRRTYRGLRFVANDPRWLALASLGVVTVSGVLYSAFEDKNVGDSIWWAVVTASTVGYGDTYPTTVAGRFVAGVLISVMVLLVVPLITAHFASKLIVDQDVFAHEEQEEIKQNLRRIREVLDQWAAAGAPTAPGTDARIDQAGGPADR